MSRDTRYERWFQSHGVKYQYLPTVELGRIDVAASLRNQSRLDRPLDPHVVDSYALAMIDDADFPALIAWKNAAGKFELISGNHRVAAAFKAEQETFDVYHVETADTDQYIRKLLTWSGNNLEGKGSDYQERMQHAIQTCRTFNRSALEVAKQFGISNSSLSQRLRTLGADERLIRLKRKPEAVTTTVRAAIASIQSDRVLTGIFDLARDAKLNDRQTRDVLETVLGVVGNEDNHVAAIVKMRQDMAHLLVQNGGNQRPVNFTARDRLLGSITGATAMIKKRNNNAEQLQITGVTDIERLDAAIRELDFNVQLVLRNARKNVGVSDVGATTMEKVAVTH